jgi:molybdopterin synthase catalytic subunit
MGSRDGCALIEVRDEPLSVDEVFKAVQRPEAGATVLFVGTVRSETGALTAVTALEYEAYRSMARSEMQKVAEQIVAESPQVRLAAVHRVGKLAVGEIAIVCGASAPHRQQAFDACRALIDGIKENVPVWKREFGADGSAWVGWGG